MNYKDALKFGFYEMQLARDWYREVTADVGMHVDVITSWIRTLALVVQPIIPHTSEHIWSTILKEPNSVQVAPWPTFSTPVNRVLLESGLYMRSIVKAIREAEGQFLKKLTKSKGPSPFDPRKPKSIRIYVATRFPDWQERPFEIIKKAYDSKTGKFDDAYVKPALAQAGLMKDKRVMPFVQKIKVNIYCFILTQKPH
ncbi:MAG TPA: class I tRNA ligase family protein [Chlamydiales bacterium]|jgi:leucyl-tRNA synthetase|nr:class I tRNA ligase family protein [Chlamydiales bacterium]